MRRTRATTRRTRIRRIGEGGVVDERAEGVGAGDNNEEHENSTSDKEQQNNTQGQQHDNADDGTLFPFDTLEHNAWRGRTRTGLILLAVIWKSMVVLNGCTDDSRCFEEGGWRHHIPKADAELIS